MNVTYTDIKNPTWANAEHTFINCEVNFDHLPEEYVPFTAVASGDIEHTHQIFAECVAGQWGPIAEYEPPPIEYYELEVRRERNSRLAQTDWTQMPDVPQAIKDLWAPYRQALRDVPQQAGFPTDVTWPTKPE